MADIKIIETCLNCLDYTTLKETDTPESVAVFTRKVLGFMDRGLPAVAAVCVYPSMIDAAGAVLAEHERGDQVGIAAVCGAFPSGQTYLEVKMLEAAMAIENGADELDVVLNLGAMLSGDYELAGSELAILKEEINGDAVLKVILETGSLVEPRLIRQASMLAMEAGADFIKTSTGKAPVSATPGAVEVMCDAIGEYGERYGRKVGIKVSGGIRTVDEAVRYCEIVRERLGEEWLCPELFRIGASRLLDALVDRLA